MKKWCSMKKIILACLISLLVPAYNSMAAETLQQPLKTLWITAEGDFRPMLVRDGKAKLVRVKIEENNPAHKYKIEVYYPQITATQLSSAEKQFNQLVSNLAQQQIKTFKRNHAIDEANKSLPLFHQGNSYLNIDYAIAGFVIHSRHTELLSARFSIEQYEFGMAHPFHHTMVVNYDLGHHQVITLSSLFKPNSHFLSVIANYCMSTLQAKHLPDMSLIKNGAGPKLRNYKNWNVTLSGLLITFEYDQVAPHYFGLQQVIIPKKILAPIVTKQTACLLNYVRCDKT